MRHANEPASKECKTCGEIKRIEDFSKVKLTKSGVPVRWNVCNPCRSQQNRRAPSAQAKLAYVAQAKDRPCMDCGIKWPKECMDFDHVRGDKKHNIGTAYWWISMAQLETEIAKCDVVCACCHRLRTLNRPHQRTGRPRRTLADVAGTVLEFTSTEQGSTGTLSAA